MLTWLDHKEDLRLFCLRISGSLLVSARSSGFYFGDPPFPLWPVQCCSVLGIHQTYSNFTSHPLPAPVGKVFSNLSIVERKMFIGGRGGWEFDLLKKTSKEMLTKLGYTILRNFNHFLPVWKWRYNLVLSWWIFRSSFAWRLTWCTSVTAYTESSSVRNYPVTNTAVFSLIFAPSPMASRSYRWANYFLNYSPRLVSDILVEWKSRKNYLFTCFLKIVSQSSHDPLDCQKLIW